MISPPDGAVGLQAGQGWITPQGFRRRERRARAFLGIVILGIIVVTVWNIYLSPGAWLGLTAFAVLIIGILFVSARWGLAKARRRLGL